jgi:hypothetical protein
MITSLQVTESIEHSGFRNTKHSKYIMSKGRKAAGIFAEIYQQVHKKQPENSALLFRYVLNKGVYGVHHKLHDIIPDDIQKVVTDFCKGEKKPDSTCLQFIEKAGFTQLTEKAVVSPNHVRVIESMQNLDATAVLRG